MKRSGFLLSLFLATSAFLPAEINTNGNAYGDVWEMVHGASSLPPEDDTDGDGFDNLEESLAGTDPFDPDSKLNAQPGGIGSDLEVSWPAIAGKRYFFETAGNLADWTEGAPWTAMASGPMTTRFPGRACVSS